MFFPLMPRVRRLPSAKSEKSKAVKIVFIMPSALEMLSARKNMREKANSRYTQRLCQRWEIPSGSFRRRKDCLMRFRRERVAAPIS